MTYKKEENYCTFSPDGLFGVRFNYACYVHDRQYRNEVEKRKTRKEADQEFRNLIYKQYRQASKKYLGWIISRIYYIAVRLFGWRSWE